MTSAEPQSRQPRCPLGEQVLHSLEALSYLGQLALGAAVELTALRGLCSVLLLGTLDFLWF